MGIFVVLLFLPRFSHCKPIPSRPRSQSQTRKSRKPQTGSIQTETQTHPNPNPDPNQNQNPSQPNIYTDISTCKQKSNLTPSKPLNLNRGPGYTPPFIHFSSNFPPPRCKSPNGPGGWRVSKQPWGMGSKSQTVFSRWMETLSSSNRNNGMLPMPLDQILPRHGRLVLGVAVAAEVVDAAISVSPMHPCMRESQPRGGTDVPLKVRHLGRAALVRDAVDLAPARGDVAVVAAAVFSLDEVAHGDMCGCVVCGVVIMGVYKCRERVQALREWLVGWLVGWFDSVCVRAWDGWMDAQLKMSLSIAPPIPQSSKTTRQKKAQIFSLGLGPSSLFGSRLVQTVEKHKKHENGLVSFPPPSLEPQKPDQPGSFVPSPPKTRDLGRPPAISQGNRLAPLPEAWLRAWRSRPISRSGDLQQHESLGGVSRRAGGARNTPRAEAGGVAPPPLYFSLSPSPGLAWPPPAWCVCNLYIGRLSFGRGGDDANSQTTPPGPAPSAPPPGWVPLDVRANAMGRRVSLIGGWAAGLGETRGVQMTQKAERTRPVI